MYYLGMHKGHEKAYRREQALQLSLFDVPKNTQRNTQEG